MNWLYVSIFAYFLYAVNFVIDKFLLTARVSNYLVYAFYTGILSVFAFFLIPFGLVLPSARELIIIILAGAAFVFSFVFFYYAMQKNEALRATAVVGALSPIFVLFFSYLFLGERLTPIQLIAFFLLIFGGALVSFEKKEGESGFSARALQAAVFAAFLFGFFYFAMKYIFLTQPFFSGFVLTRISSFFVSFLLLVPRGSRRVILEHIKKLQTKTGFFVVMNKILGGTAFIIINYAIFLGSASFVSALQGLQYGFLFILIIFISKFYPHILKEKLTVLTALQKLIAILFIVAGIAFLTL